jgi:hypothetical protein
MANWAHVENNIIKELHDQLPVSWRNISGLRKSENDLEFLSEIGWYPVNKDYDLETKNIIGYNHQYLNSSVIETPIVAEIPPINEPSFEYKKVEFLENLRKIRNEKLLMCDWTNLVDTQDMMTDEQKTQWRDYRQMLRDITSIYETNEVIDISEVIWPKVPEV